MHLEYYCPCSVKLRNTVWKINTHRPKSQRSLKQSRCPQHPVPPILLCCFRRTWRAVFSGVVFVDGLKCIRLYHTPPTVFQAPSLALSDLTLKMLLERTF